MQELKMTGEEIVISGISGIYPNTENTRDLIRNLYNKVDMVTESTDTSVKHAELPKHFGKIHGLEKFDAQFFRVTPVQADSFDPVGRKILEQAYSAIFDAGINPETLKGSSLGVFIGSSMTDHATLNLFDYFKQNGYSITGCSKTMLANRISYWIDGKGPSYGLDHACASSIACLELAFRRMKAGECDAALVGGCNHSVHPTLTINMKRAGLLCLDGKTKCFDGNGNGFVRSDAINIFFLQKSRDAKRIYAEVVNVNEKFFTKPDGLFLPSRNPEDVVELMENLYSDIDVSPEEVEYVEANATGLAEADANEVEAIAKVFAKNKPIKVGSVKSNMGHTQAVSGACSITKLCVSYQKGIIPANLHYKGPSSLITKDGRVQVVTEHTKFGRGFTALNNFSMNGANYHVLLKGHYKPKQLDLYQTSLPRLVLVSGRDDSSVGKICDILENNPIDVEELALLNNIFKHNIPGHTGRGYTILVPTDNPMHKCLGKGFEYYSGTARPVWFLYSGMGSQWHGMGTALMRMPIFTAAIQRCNDVLLPKGLDVHKIITENDGTTFDNILHSFVGITAVQIGLTDILKSMGLKPNNIIGHSAGEIACAYADECLSAEECILLSYYRGLVSLQTMLIKGKMAAIGLGHKEVRDICPPEIDIACKNSATSTTISGPADAVEKIVAGLQSRSIFARVVASSNIAYHSRYIANAGPKLMAELKKVLKNPKLRSQKWLSTCFLPNQWDDVISKTASPEYFTYNLLNPVHFEEAATMIPANAIVIEVAPHGLMQAIVKRSHSSCLNIALTKRGSEDNVVVLLNALGTLYQAGVSLNVDVLYPPIEFPVSTETPVISHFVGWEHSKNWSTNNFDLIQRTKIFAKEFDISIHDDEYQFIKQYKRNGINIFPESAILVKVWETAAMFKETTCEHLPIIFTNVNFHDQVRVKSEEVLRLRVHVQLGSNLFEVTHGDKLVTSGLIRFDFQNILNCNPVSINDSDYNLNNTDLYKLMNFRGYGYKDKFKSIHSAITERSQALLKWENDWILFLDALFQLSALSRDCDGVSVVKLINELSINPIQHKELQTAQFKNICYAAQIFKDLDICRSGGVVLKSITFDDEPVLEQTIDKLLIHKPHGKGDVQREALEVESQCNNLIVNLDNVKLVNNGNTFVWTEFSPKKESIQVAFVGISLNKHASSSNKINQFGTDFSGITAKGQPVMGIVPDNNITKLVEPYCEFLWPVPLIWNMEEAATVPLPYIQAYYCLTFRKSLKTRDTVLISNGDTGFGQALISICISYDCTIFTTVKNLAKKKILLRVFPELDGDKIGCSNEDSFLHMVRSATNGNGCDLVVNDNSEALREATMGCVGASSTFLNICEVGMKMNETFGMASLTYCRNYMSVCFSNIFLKENDKARKILHSLLVNGIASGVVRPLTRVVYTLINMSRAFQLLLKDNHTGRVLTNMRDTNILKSSYDILPRIELNARHLYMVVCDGSELGVELVGHLIRRGARRLLLHVEPHMRDGYFHVRYIAWKKYKVEIHFNSEDLHTKSETEKFIKVALKLGNVGGIFICRNEVNGPEMDREKKNASIITALDVASRGINTLLYFAVLALTVQGSSTNAEYSNIEKCCFERHKIGLPTLALRHAMNKKKISQPSLSRLFNVLDLSLKGNFISVLSSDHLEEPQLKKNPVLTGFEAFFRQFDIDEYTASEPMICMKTQLNNENESELYIDPDEDHLIIVPGFDGLYQNMTAVSERLKILAVTLQLEPDFDKSIDQIASRLVDLIKTRLHLKSKFYLLGYSFGVIVALKTAALLEKDGRSGKVFCLGSSPDALKTQLNDFFGDMTDAQLQNSLIQHIYYLVTGKTSTGLNKTLEHMKNWLEKVELFIRIAKKSVFYTHEYLRSYINVSYRRVVLAREYQPDFKLNSEVVLIKGASFPKCELSEDYGLSKLTNKPVKVFDIQADHASAPQDGRVSNIVNKMLDPDHLDRFKNKNSCQYYLQ